MPVSVTCPNCDARLSLREPPATNARLKCPKCSGAFAYVGPDGSERAAPKKSAVVAAPPPDRRPRRDDDDEGGDVRPRRAEARSDDSDDDLDLPRKRKKKKVRGGANLGLIFGLLGVCGVLLCGLVVALVVLLGRSGSTPNNQQQAAINPALNAPPGSNVPVVPPSVPGQPAAQPGVPPSAQPAGTPTAGGPYGDPGGEQIAPADPNLPNTLLRARRDDTFFQLSNPREAQVRGPDAKGKGDNAVHDAFLIDFKVLRRGKFDGGTLVIVADDGNRTEVELRSVAGRDHGTIELIGITHLPGKVKAQPSFRTQFPKNAEMYVTRGDDRYRPPAKFIVSNSLVRGSMKVTTRARDWTREELDRYGKPPPGYLAPNENLAVGEDVPPLTGWTWKARFVEPEGRLLGLEYNMGEWNKEKRIGGLVPVFSLDQPQSKPARDVARPGFAVAGAEMNDKQGMVYGIRLLYRRVKPDGTFDAADAYAGEWIGTPPAAAPKTLANDGRRVLGMSYQSGAIVDRFALVVAK